MGTTCRRDAHGLGCDCPGCGRHPGSTLALFGVGMVVSLVTVAGNTLWGLARLAVHGTPYPGHWHGFRERV